MQVNTEIVEVRLYQGTNGHVYVTDQENIFVDLVTLTRVDERLVSRTSDADRLLPFKPGDHIIPETIFGISEANLTSLGPSYVASCKIVPYAELEPLVKHFVKERDTYPEAGRALDREFRERETTAYAAYEKTRQDSDAAFQRQGRAPLLEERLKTLFPSPEQGVRAWK